MPNDKDFDPGRFGPVDDRIREIAERKDLPTVFCRGADSRKLFKQLGYSLEAVQKPTCQTCANF